jgi:hypothetical protein
VARGGEQDVPVDRTLSPGELLDPRHEVVPFHGRVDELAELARWRDGDDACSALLLRRQCRRRDRGNLVEEDDGEVGLLRGVDLEGARQEAPPSVQLLVEADGDALTVGAAMTGRRDHTRRDQDTGAPHRLTSGAVGDDRADVRVAVAVHGRAGHAECGRRDGQSGQGGNEDDAKRTGHWWNLLGDAGNCGELRGSARRAGVLWRGRRSRASPGGSRPASARRGYLPPKKPYLALP